MSIRKERRTPGSSSTMNTVASFFMRFSQSYRQGEVEGRAASRIGGIPKTASMIAHDGAADRKTQPDSRRLGREEWVVQLRGVAGKPDSVVRDIDLDLLLRGGEGPNPDDTPLRFGILHRVGRVADEIEDHLLDLDHIDLHRGQGIV